MSNGRTTRAAILLMAMTCLCACGESGSITVTLRGTVPIAIEKASTVAFSADGKTIAVTGYNKQLVFVDVTSGTLRSRIEKAHNHCRILHSGFVSNLVTGSWDGIKVWEPGAETPLVSIEEAGTEYTEHEFEGIIAVGGRTRTGPFKAGNFKGTMYSMGVTPDGLFVVAVGKQSGDQSVAVWDLQSGDNIEVVAGAEHAVLSPDGELIAVSEREQVDRIDLGTSVKFVYHNTTTLYSVPILAEQGDLSGIWALGFSPDGSSLVGKNDAEEFVHLLIDGTTIATLEFVGNVRFTRFSFDAKFILLANGHDIICFDATTGARLWKSSMDADEAGQIVQVTPDNRHVIFCGRAPGSPVQIADLKTGKILATVKSKSIPNGFALSPDGRTLAIPMFRDDLALWTIGG